MKRSITITLPISILGMWCFTGIVYGQTICPENIVGNVTTTCILARAGEATNSTGTTVIGGAVVGTISNTGLTASIKSAGIQALVDETTIATISNGSSVNSTATISGPNAFLLNASTISTVNNYGIIKSTTDGTSIQMGRTGKIITLNNYSTGNISGGINGISVGDGSAGCPADGSGSCSLGGSIGSINNYGNIAGTSNAGITTRGGQITTINNFSTGTISGNIGIYRSQGSINAINNYGKIQGITSGVLVEYSISGVIDSFVNSGVIAASSGEGLFTRGHITTLTNTGLIYGGGTGTVFSLGAPLSNRITTLNNLQGPGTASPSNLTIPFSTDTFTNNAIIYRGALPKNYNIIIKSPAQYGSMIYQFRTSTSPGTMNFNIYGNTGTTQVSGVPSSTLTAGTYIAVLKNIFTTQTAATSNYGSPWPVKLLNTSGTYPSGAGSYSWTLVEVAATPGVWDLVVTGSSGTRTGSGTGGNSNVGGSVRTNIISGLRVDIPSIGVTVNPVFAGGALVLSNGDNSTVPLSVTSLGGTVDNLTSGSATLSGELSGEGSLTFTGTGNTTISGANTYSGGTTVAGGTLTVAGNSPTGTGEVYVAPAGRLTGTGTIAGNAIVSGVINPGNSPGYLSFTQDLTLNSGASYQQDISGTMQASSSSPVGASGYYSFVSLGGRLVINSDTTLTPRLSNLFSASEVGYGSSIYVPALGDLFRMLTAAGGITGRFTTLTQPPELSSGTQLIAFYNVNNSNSVDLATVPTSYSTTLSSSTTNTKKVAGVLDQLLGVNKANTATASQDSVLYAVAGQTGANLPGFAQALAGEIHAASAAALAQTTQRAQHAVMVRLGDYPMAPVNINPAASHSLLTASVSASNPSGLPTANMSSNPEVNPKADNLTSAAIANGNVWGEIAYQRGDRASNSGGKGFNNNLYQVVLGADTYTDAALGVKLGGGLALSNTTVNATGGNSTIQQGALFVYGKMPIAGDYILDGMASIGMSSTSLSRSDTTGLSGGFSNKSVMGNDALVSLGLSRPFDYEGLRLTPYARLTYQYVGQASYDEGSSAAALRIASFSASAGRGAIGVAAGSLNKDPLKDEYTYRANVAVGADTAGLLNPMLNTSLGGFSSSVTTATAGSAFVQVSLYGTVKVADNAYAYAGVSGEVRTGQTLYGGSVGLRVAF